MINSVLKITKNSELKLRNKCTCLFLNHGKTGKILRLLINRPKSKWRHKLDYVSLGSIFCTPLAQETKDKATEVGSLIGDALPSGVYTSHSHPLEELLTTRQSKSYYLGGLKQPELWLQFKAVLCTEAHTPIPHQDTHGSKCNFLWKNTYSS